MWWLELANVFIVNKHKGSQKRTGREEGGLVMFPFVKAIFRE